MLGRNSLIALALIPVPATAGTYPSQCPKTLPGWLNQSGINAVDGLDNRVHLGRDGSLRWNGTRVTTANIESYASIVVQMRPQPLTVLEIEDGASCDQVQAIRQLLDAHAQCAGGARCGEGVRARRQVK
jgi:hypothetical protein